MASGKTARTGTRRRWVKSHSYHLLFAGALLMLSLLIAWWAIFISRSVEQTRSARYRNLELRARLAAAATPADTAASGKPSPQDPELLVRPCPRVSQKFVFRIHSSRRDLCVAPDPELVATIEQDYRKKWAMLIGEASLSVVLVLVTGFMLFRLIATENRSAHELRSLWGRVTHELKSPITGVKAFLQTLYSQDLSREELKPLVEMALQEVERQQRLAENLLVGQRLGGFSEQVIEAVRVVPYLEDFVRRPRLKLPSSHFSLVPRCPKELRVAADPNGLRIILDNLVDNAVKYGGESVRVTVTVMTEGDWARLVVADTGPGFPPEQAEGLFAAYRRLANDPGTSRQGTGMGLYISRSLAREMGGELEAFCDGAGKGARFVLSLVIRGS